MGEPRRWTLLRTTNLMWMSGEHNDIGGPMRVREDQATETEKAKLAAWLEDHYGTAVRDQIGEWGGREEWGADARELLDLVLGEEASRV